MKIDIPGISERLLAVASLVPQCSRICDIGCDHGLLPIYLTSTESIVSAIACDIGRGPLRSAEANIKKYGMEKRITTRLSDGFSALSPGEADCYILSGMGGILIKDILERGFPVWKDADALIVSPQRDQDLVRRYLSSLCHYDRDIFLKEGREFYTVMRFLPGKPPYDLSHREELFGKSPTSDYLRHCLRIEEKIYRGLKMAKSSDTEEKKSMVNERIALIKELLDR